MTRRKEGKKGSSARSKSRLASSLLVCRQSKPRPCEQVVNCRRDKLKQEITRVENEKTDLSLELSFVRDKLQQKTATADTLEIELLELGAKLDKSTRDYVSQKKKIKFTTSCACKTQ